MKTFFATDHDIDHHLIDPDALFVIHRLRGAGFDAYLVGGSVRDLLARKVPKDFDISTSARPEQVKQLFRRGCILIGRRFRLAHLRFGHKIIEVATFRAGDNEDDLIVQDNRWGTPEEDVLRRDFTINGLLYDPTTHSVIDYVGGWDDIHKGILRTIGNPATRFRQDPVRMIRLLKFQARFGFSVDQETSDALTICREELVKSSPARILEEIFRMLESGASSSFFHLMTQSGLLSLLFPCLTHFLESEQGKKVYQYLNAVDSIHQNLGKSPLNRAILTSCLLFPILEREIHEQFLSKNLVPHMGDILTVTSSLIKGFVTSSFSHFPRRISATMGFILSTQYRLTPLSGRKRPRQKMMHLKEFELALRFLKIRAMIDNDLLNTYAYWKDLQRTKRMNKS